MRLEAYLKKYSNKLKPRVTGLLVKPGKVLLGIKKEGIGEGKYIGIGGKKEGRESLISAIKRELKEEIKIEPLVLYKTAELDFYFEKSIDWNQRVNVFICTKWRGRITETGEITPEWFSINALPFDKMWEDGLFYLPHVLMNRYVRARFLYDKNNHVIDCDINVRLLDNNKGKL